MQRPPGAMNGGGPSQIHLPQAPPARPPAWSPAAKPPAPALPSMSLPPRPGVPVMNGPPSGPHHRLPHAPPPGPPLGPPQGPPALRAPVVNGQSVPWATHLGPPSASPTIKPPSPINTTTPATTTTAAPLVNGYQQPPSHTPGINDGLRQDVKNSPRASPRMSPVPSKMGPQMGHQITPQHPSTTGPPQQQQQQEAPNSMVHDAGMNINNTPKPSGSSVPVSNNWSSQKPITTTQNCSTSQTIPPRPVPSSVGYSTGLPHTPVTPHNPTIPSTAPSMTPMSQPGPLRGTPMAPPRPQQPLGPLPSFNSSGAPSGFPRAPQDGPGLSPRLTPNTSQPPPVSAPPHIAATRPTLGPPQSSPMGGIRPGLTPPPTSIAGQPFTPTQPHPPTSQYSQPLPPPLSTSTSGPPSMSPYGPPVSSAMGPSVHGPPTSLPHGPPPTSTAMGPPPPLGRPPTSTAMGPPMGQTFGMAPSPVSPASPYGQPPAPMGPPPTRPFGVPPKGTFQQPSPASGAGVPRYPGQQYSQAGVNQVSQQFGSLSVTKDGWNKGWGTHQIDLMQQRQVVPPGGVVPPKPVLAQEYLPNCSPDIFRCTLTKVPESKGALQKSKLPFGLLIHPFRDLEHLPVVSCNTIVRCRTCRTYINPFVVFKGERRWECNLCFRVNELPEEFQYDPVSRTYGDPSRRPEVREATIEFIAPQEYMLRPPQPATYLWLLDVTRQAVDTGYLKVVCEVLLSQLDKIPGDRRTLVGFITFSSSVQFYLLGEEQKNVQMLDVGEVDNIFVPNPDDLLVNLEQSRTLVEDFLVTLPEAHASACQTQSALGAALQAAYKLMSAVGGRITVMTTTLPTVGPGALKPREDPNQRAGKDIQNMGPATDFYKKLALDCSGQQIAVDLFALNSQYIDLATLSGMSKFSGGCIHHFPNFHVVRNPATHAPFVSCLTRYITRKIGFEAVMRIRATRGLAITNFHGNFFVRSTDLLSLPNINPDAGFGMQVNIEEPLHNIRTACFQAALLYTSSKGERRIRVHTLCLPVSPNQHEIVTSADQETVVGLLVKMAVDRCLTSSLTDARDALVNATVDALTAYRSGLSHPAHGALEAPPTLQLLPLLVLAVMKSVAFRGGLSTKLDDRLFAMCQLKTLPLGQLMTLMYPDLYPVHDLTEKGALEVDDQIIPQPGCLHLSAERLERCGAYLLDAGDTLFLYIRCGISSAWVEATLGVPSYAVIPQPLYEDPLPDLDTTESLLLRNLVAHIQRKKPYHAPLVVLKEDNPARMLFIQHLLDDRTEGSHSYVEFLQFLKSQVK